MRNDLLEAVKESNVSDFSLVSLHKYESVLIDILDRFTSLGKKGLDHYWWWDSFNQSHVTAMPTYAPNAIEKFFDRNEKVWFVAEDWHASKKAGCFWLYESSLGSVIKVLNEMYGFEYYIVNRKMEWMIGENHHDILFALGGHAIKTVMESNMPDKTLNSTPKSRAN